MRRDGAEGSTGLLTARDAARSSVATVTPAARKAPDGPGPGVLVCQGGGGVGHVCEGMRASDVRQR